MVEAIAVPSSVSNGVAGLYRHKDGSYMFALGKAKQVTFKGDGTLFCLGILCQNSEEPWQTSELYLADDCMLAFRPQHHDWYMPGDWVVYWEPSKNKYWIRPYAMFFEVVSGGVRIFERLTC